MMREAVGKFDVLTSYIEKMSPEVILKVHSISDAGVLADYIIPVSYTHLRIQTWNISIHCL